MDNLGRSLLFALVTVVFMLPMASAGYVEVYLNDSENLELSETEITIKYGKDFTLTFQVGGPYRDDENEKFVTSIYVDIHFLSDEIPRRDVCTKCVNPAYKPLDDSDPDPGYDTFKATVSSDMEALDGYSGKIQLDIIMKNNTADIVWDNVFEITIGPASSGDSGSSFAFSIPELPPVIEENLLEIGVGLLVFIILAVGIYTFILAPEDTTADLFKEKESIDPLSKSLTGVGYDSDLPGEEEEDEDDDTEDLLDDDEEEFDESKLLAELTGPQKLESDDEEEGEEEEPEPPKAEPKKPVKKKVVRKSVSKKVVRKAAPPQDTPMKPPVNMGEGIINITCPSCTKVHNVDEDTVKFICSCGRRIRVN